MNPAYFETHFLLESPSSDWPAEFAIITAYATSGETWTAEQNQAADKRLETELRTSARWMKRLTGYSPTSGHAEPGWAVDMNWTIACDIGQRYKQEAIYFVIKDSLYVTHCDPQKRGLIPVGAFLERLALTRHD